MIVATYLFGALFVLIGVRIAISTVGALGPLRRIQKHPTRKVSELVAGPAEVSGTIRAVEGALRTCHNKPAVVVRTVLSRYSRRHGKALSAPGAVDLLTSARAELTDATGSCALVMDSVVLIGARFDGGYAAADFERAWPELWTAVVAGRREGEVIETVGVEQTFIPDGCAGFVSGECLPDDSVAPGDGYRATRARFRLTGTRGEALIVSAFPEPVVKRFLGRPALVLGWMAALFFAVGAALLALPGWVQSFVRQGT